MDATSTSTRIRPTLILVLVLAIAPLSWTSSFSSTPEFSVSFVTYGGRPGHEGYLPLEGNPVAGVSQKLLATSRNSFQAIGFFLERVDDHTRTPLDLVAGGPDTPDGGYLGTTTVPGYPFKIIAVGHDAAGQAFETAIPDLFSPVAFDVRFPNAAVLPIGRRTSIPVSLRNYSSEAATVSLTTSVESGPATVTSGNPLQVTVAALAELQAVVELLVPADASPDGLVSLRVVVRPEGDHHEQEDSDRTSLSVARVVTPVAASTLNCAQAPSGSGMCQQPKLLDGNEDFTAVFPAHAVNSLIASGRSTVGVQARTFDGEWIEVVFLLPSDRSRLRKDATVRVFGSDSFSARRVNPSSISLEGIPAVHVSVADEGSAPANGRSADAASSDGSVLGGGGGK